MNASSKGYCVYMRAAKVLASVCEQQRFLRVLRATKVIASVASSIGSCECCEQQRFLRVYACSKGSCERWQTANVLASRCEQQRFLRAYANSKGSCDCCEQQRFLRAAKVLASVASNKGYCACNKQQRFFRVLRAAKVLVSGCEQQRFLLVYAAQQKFLRADANSKGSCERMRTAKVLARV